MEEGRGRGEDREEEEEGVEGENRGGGGEAGEGREEEEGRGGRGGARAGLCQDTTLAKHQDLFPPRLASRLTPHRPALGVQYAQIRPNTPPPRVSRNRVLNPPYPPPMASSSAGPARLLLNFDESSVSSTSGTPPALPRPPAPTAEDDNGDDGDDEDDDEDDPVSSHFRDIDERGNRYFLYCFLTLSSSFLLLPPAALTLIPQDILQTPPKTSFPLLPLLGHCLPCPHHRPPKSHIFALQFGHRPRLPLPPPQHRFPAEPHRNLP